MKLHTTVLILVISFGLKSNLGFSQKKDEIFGVLVQVQAESVLQNEAFQKLLVQHKLSKTKWYPSLKTYSLKANQKTKRLSKIKADEICKDFNDLPQVVHCEHNKKLKPTTHNPLDKDTDVMACEKEESTFPLHSSTLPILNILRSSTDNSCKLVPTISNGSLPPHQNKFLSAFWAQEYTGSDLVREELNGDNTGPIPDDLFDIWDTDNERHGHHVSHLIASPSLSAPLTTKDAKNHVNLQETEDYLSAYEKAYNSCKNSGCFPRVINNSMSWQNSALVKSAVEKIVDSGSVFVVAAGNSSETIDPLESELVKKINLLL